MKLMEDMDLHKPYLEDKQNQLAALGAVALLFVLLAAPNSRGIKDNLAVLAKAYYENTGTIPKITCAPEPPAQFGKKPDKARAAQTILAVQNATQELRKAHGKFKGNKDAAEELQRAAQERKHALIEAMRENPTAAIFGLASPEERKDINAVSNGCVEQKVSKEGRLEVLHADFFDDKTSAEQYTLVTKQKERIALHPARGFKQNLVSGTEVKVAGLQLDGDLLFDGAATVQNPSGELGGLAVTQAAPDSPPVYGEQKTLVVLLDFQDTQPQEPYHPIADVEALMDETNAYYQENSYGQMSLRGVANPNKSADVFGWYQIPMNTTCDFSEVRNRAIGAVNPSVNLTDYTRLVIVAPTEPCSWIGISTFGKIPIQTSDGLATMSVESIYSPFATVGLVGHELGHGFGNMHANFMDCGNEVFAQTGCTFNEYGDWYDIMGEIMTSPHYNAAHKDHTGWFNQPGAPSSKTITANGTYAIEPLAATSTGLKTIKLKRAFDQYSNLYDYLYVEYRQPIGNDSELGTVAMGSTNAFRGALIHTMPRGDGSSYLVDTSPPSEYPDEGSLTPALLPGTTLTDPATGSTVRVVSKTPEALTVNVILGGKTDFIPPEVLITFPAETTFATGTLNITASASDASGIEKVEFYHYACPSGCNKVLFATDTTAPYEAMLDTTQLPNFDNLIIAKAYDLSGTAWNAWNNMADSPWVLILADNEAPSVAVNNPSQGTVVKGLLNINGTSSDNYRLQSIEIYKDADTAPFSILYPPLYPVPRNFSFFTSLDTTTLIGGPHTLNAKVYDASQNSFLSGKTHFTVDNTSPVIFSLQPQSGTKVFENISLAVNATDNLALQKAEFFLDDLSLGVGTNGTILSCDFDSVSITLATTCKDGETPSRPPQSTVGYGGVIGRAAYFWNEGILQYPSAGNFVSQKGAIDFWTKLDFNPRSASNDKTFFDARSSASTLNNPVLKYDSGDRSLKFKVNKPGGSACIVSTTDIRDWEWGYNGGWHRITAMWDANNPSQSLELLTDGNPATSPVSCSGGNGWTPGTTEEITIGSSYNGTTSADSRIDEFKIFDNTAPSTYRFSWSSTRATNGTHALSAKAVDLAGNETDTPPQTINIQNFIGGGNAGKKPPLQRTE